MRVLARFKALWPTDGQLERKFNVVRLGGPLNSLVVVGLILIFTASASACDSYEECMKTKRTGSGSVDYAQRDYIKAIAYKLDEISKKLDFTESDKKMNKLMAGQTYFENAVKKQ